MGAAGVMVSAAPIQEAGAGSTPSAALHNLKVSPIPVLAAKKLLERNHYLHSLPGGTKVAFGVFTGQRLVGALTFGVGPFLAKLSEVECGRAQPSTDLLQRIPGIIRKRYDDEAG